jgi:hypothetical protein
MLRYQSKLSDSPLDSTGTERPPEVRARNSKQNCSTKFWSSLHESQQDRLSEVDRGDKPRIVYQHAAFAATLLFLLMFSGPPKFRLRDPEASLRGEVDWVVVLHIVVWGLAGAWVLIEIGKRGRVKLLLNRLSLPQELGVAMTLCLAVSALISKAPALSAFKIYQMAVSLLFIQFYVQRFGRASCLKTIFWGSALLCGALVVCAFLAPDLVWTGSDFNPDPSRLKGDLIAPSGSVSALAIILLLTGVRKIWRILPLTLLGLFFGLLVFSLMRTAYAVICGFFVLVLLKRPDAKSLRQFTYSAAALALLIFAYHWLPSLSEYRKPETISDFSDRIGLWHYLSSVTVTRSPWLGLGYYSASRVYGPLYNPGLGNAHSMFFEILLGGGAVSFVLFIALCALLSVHAAYLIYKNQDRFSFAIASLFFASLVFGSMGDEIDSGPVAMCFWYSAAVLPWLYERSSKHARHREELRSHLPMTANALNSEIS